LPGHHSAAAQRLSASPFTAAWLSILFAVAAADGGLLANFQSNVKASVLTTSSSFAIHAAARLTGPLPRDRRRRAHHQTRSARQEAAQSRAASEPAGGSARTGEPDRRTVRMPDTGATCQGTE
jgi:hypothetical protein